MRWLLALALCLSSASVQAQDGAKPLSLESPYAASVREHYYAALRKEPARAFALELLLPGAGNAYDGLYVPAAVTLAVSVAGAALCVAGALRDRDAQLWSGVGALVAGRAYGLISAPVHAVLLNAAFRRQLGIRR